MLQDFEVEDRLLEVFPDALLVAVDPAPNGGWDMMVRGDNIKYNDDQLKQLSDIMGTEVRPLNDRTSPRDGFLLTSSIKQ